MPRIQRIASDSYAIIFDDRAIGNNLPAITAKEFDEHLKLPDQLRENLDIDGVQYELNYELRADAASVINMINIRQNGADFSSFVFAKNTANIHQITIGFDQDLTDENSIGRKLIDAYVVQCSGYKERLLKLHRLQQEAFRNVFEYVPERQSRYYKSGDNFYLLSKRGDNVVFSKLEGSRFNESATLSVNRGEYELQDNGIFGQLDPNNLVSVEHATVFNKLQEEGSYLRSGKTAYCKRADGSFRKISYRDENSPLIVAVNGVENITLNAVFADFAAMDGNALPQDVAIGNLQAALRPFNDSNLPLGNIGEIVEAQELLTERQNQLQTAYEKFAFGHDVEAYHIKHGVVNYLVTRNPGNNTALILNTVDDNFELQPQGSLTLDDNGVYVVAVAERAVLDREIALAIFSSERVPQAWGRDKIDFIAAARNATRDDRDAGGGNRLYRDANIGCYVSSPDQIFRVDYTGDLGNGGPKRVGLFDGDIAALTAVLRSRDPKTSIELTEQLTAAVAGISVGDRGIELGADNSISAAVAKQNEVAEGIRKFGELKGKFHDKLRECGFVAGTRTYDGGRVVVTQSQIDGDPNRIWQISIGDNQHYRISFADNGVVNGLTFAPQAEEANRNYENLQFLEIANHIQTLNGIIGQIKTNNQLLEEIRNVMPEDSLISQMADDGSISYYRATQNPPAIFKYHKQGNAWVEAEIVNTDVVSVTDFVTKFEAYRTDANRADNPAFPQIQLNEIRQQIFALVEQDPRVVSKNLKSATTGRATEAYKSVGGKWYKFDGQSLGKIRDTEDGRSRLPSVLELVTELNTIKDGQIGFGVLNKDTKNLLITGIKGAGVSEIEAIKIANQFLGFGEIVGDKRANPPVFVGAEASYYRGRDNITDDVRDVLAAFARSNNGVEDGQTNAQIFADSNDPHLKNLAGVFYELVISGDAFEDIREIEGFDKEKAIEQASLDLYQQAMNGGCRAALDAVIRCYKDGVGCDKNQSDIQNRLAVLENLAEVLAKPKGTIDVDGTAVKVELVNGGVQVTKGAEAPFIIKADLNGYDPNNADQASVISQIKFALLQERAETVTYGVTRTPIKTIHPAVAPERDLLENFSKINGYVTIAGDGDEPAGGWPRYQITKVAGEADKYDLKQEKNAGASYRISFGENQVKVTKRNQASSNSHAVSATVAAAIEFDDLRLGFIAVRDRQYGWEEADRQTRIIEKLNQLDIGVNGAVEFNYDGNKYSIQRGEKEDENTFKITKKDTSEEKYQIKIEGDPKRANLQVKDANGDYVAADDKQDFLAATLMLQSFQSQKEKLAALVAKIPNDTRIKVTDRSDPAAERDRYFIVDRSNADNPILKEVTYKISDVVIAAVPEDNATTQVLINLLSQDFLETKNTAQLVNECRNMMFANHDVKKEGAVQTTVFTLDDQKYYVGGVASSVMYRVGNQVGEPDVEMKLMEVIDLKTKLRNKEIVRINYGLGIEDAKDLINRIENALAEDNRIAMRLAKGVTNKYNTEVAGRIAVDFLGLGVDEDASKEKIEGIYKGAPDKVKEVLREFVRNNIVAFSSDNANRWKRNLAGVFKEIGIHVDPVAKNEKEALELYKNSAIKAGVDPINHSALENVIRCYRQGIGIDDAEKAAYKTKADILEDLQWAFNKHPAKEFAGYKVTITVEGFKLGDDDLGKIKIAGSDLPNDPKYVAVLNAIRQQRSSERLQETFEESVKSFNNSLASMPYWESAAVGIAAGSAVAVTGVVAGTAVLGAGVVAGTAAGVAAGAYYGGVGVSRGATAAGVNYARVPLNVDANATVNTAPAAANESIAKIIVEAAQRKVRGEHAAAGGGAVNERYQVFEEKTVAQSALRTKRYSLRRVDEKGYVIKTEPYFFINIDERDSADPKITRIEKRQVGVVGRNSSVDLGSYSLNAAEEDKQNFEVVAAILGGLRQKTGFANEAEISLITGLDLKDFGTTAVNDPASYVRYQFQGTVGGEKGDYEITKETKNGVDEYIIARIKGQEAQNYAKITVNAGVVRVYAADANSPDKFLADVVNEPAKFWEIRNLLDGLSKVEGKQKVTKAQALFDDRVREMEANSEYSHEVADPTGLIPQHERKVYFIKTLDAQGNPTLHQYKKTADGVMTEVEAGAGYELKRDQFSDTKAEVFKTWSAVNPFNNGIKGQKEVTSFVTDSVAEHLKNQRTNAGDHAPDNYEARNIGAKNYNAYRANGTSYVVQDGKLRGLKIERNRVYSGEYTATLQPEFNGFETAQAASEIIAEAKRREVETSLAQVRDYLVGKVVAQMALDPLKDQKAHDIVDAFLGVRDLRQGPPVEIYPTNRPDPAAPPVPQELSNEIKAILESYATLQVGYNLVKPVSDADGNDITIASKSLHQHLLGVFSERGADGKAINLVDARNYYQESANRGNAYAQNAMGRLAGNDEEKVKWFVKSAKQGNKAAMENLISGNHFNAKEIEVLKTMMQASGHKDLNMRSFVHGERKYEVSGYDIEKGFVITGESQGAIYGSTKTELARVRITDQGVEVSKVIDSSLRQFFGGMGIVGEDGKTERSHNEFFIVSKEATKDQNYGRGKVTKALDDIAQRVIYNHALKGDINAVQDAVQKELQKHFEASAVGVSNEDAEKLSKQFLNIIDEKGDGSDYVSKSDLLSKQPSEVRMALHQFVKNNIKAFEHSDSNHFQDLAGQFYLDGIGVDMDRKKAFDHFCVAADAKFKKQDKNNLISATADDKDAIIKFGGSGSAIALYHLGSFFRSANSVMPRDSKKAYECWEKAGDFQPAKMMVANALLTGDGVNINYKDAAKKAKELTLPKSAGVRAEVLIRNSKNKIDGLIEAQKLLTETIKEKPNADPALYLKSGSLYEKGIGFSGRRDALENKYKSAEKQYDLGIKGGNTGCMRALADLYENGKLGSQNNSIGLAVAEVLNKRAIILDELEKITVADRESENFKGGFVIVPSKSIFGRSVKYKVTKVENGYFVSVNGEEKEGFEINYSGRFFTVSAGKLTSKENGLYSDEAFGEIYSHIVTINNKNSYSAVVAGSSDGIEKLSADLAARLDTIGKLNGTSGKILAEDILGLTYRKIGIRLADDKGSRHSEYSVGHNLIDGITTKNNEVVLVLKNFIEENKEKLKNSPYPHIQNLMGMFYEKGLILPVNPITKEQEAAGYYKKAADQGYMPAKYNLVRYNNGAAYADDAAKRAALKPIVEAGYIPAVIDYSQTVIADAEARIAALKTSLRLPAAASDEDVVARDRSILPEVLGKYHAALTKDLAWARNHNITEAKVPDKNGVETKTIKFDPEYGFTISNKSNPASNDVIKVSSITEANPEITVVRNGLEYGFKDLKPAQLAKVRKTIEDIMKDIGKERSKEEGVIKNIQGIAPTTKPIPVKTENRSVNFGIAKTLASIADRMVGNDGR